MYNESLQPIVDKIKAINDECYVHSYSKESLIWCFGSKVFHISSIVNGIYNVYLHIEPSIKLGNSVILKRNITLSQLLHFINIPKIHYPSYLSNMRIVPISKERYLKIDSRTISRVA